MYVLIVGNPCEDCVAYGPFKDPMQAAEWADGPGQQDVKDHGVSYLHVLKPVGTEEDRDEQVDNDRGLGVQDSGSGVHMDGCDPGDQAGPGSCADPGHGDPGEHDEPGLNQDILDSAERISAMPTERPGHGRPADSLPAAARGAEPAPVRSEYWVVEQGNRELQVNEVVYGPMRPEAVVLGPYQDLDTAQKVVAFVTKPKCVVLLGTMIQDTLRGTVVPSAPAHTPASDSRCGAPSDAPAGRGPSVLHGEPGGGGGGACA